MIFVNLTTVHICVPRKYSNFKIVMVLTAYTIAVCCGVMAFLNQFESFGNGNGLFVIAGFIYLIPLKFLYKESLSYILEVLCSSWIYTMLGFAISVHIAKIFDEIYLAPITLISQTVYYLATVFLFWKFIRKKLIYVLQNIPQKTRSFLRYGSILWFFTVTMLNLSYVSVNNGYLKVVTLFLLGGASLISYLLIYEVTRVSNKAHEMKLIAATDYLTNLPNRYSLWNDVEKLIEKETHFNVFFLDLNKFKAVNDKYGHLAGDAYLSIFAENAKLSVGEKGTLYRISGDEFILVCSDYENCVQEIKQIIQGISFEDDSFGEFNGVSIGVSCYPQDATDFDRLIAISDQRMYENKRLKNQS